ncbi:MAG TPA: 50S ribosomal protein L18 [Gammaproteobacteria bacterium]|nr:50S ribosomal protein L18 [Gammaproteobacteria bacterium]
MASKQQSRIRRARKTRAKIREQEIIRLSIYRTSQHTYAQIIDDAKGLTLVSASTLEVEVRDQVRQGGNVEAARLIGKRIAEKALASGIQRVAFDRSGFKYHGRVQALADEAREHGLQI